MNIFWLDNDPRLAAKYHCDKHVVKMTLESAQILCSALQRLGLQDPDLYRPTHFHHPCVTWAATSADNWQRTFRLFNCLLEEYTYRYTKVHACNQLVPLLEDLFPYASPLFPVDGPTDAPRAMPEQYHDASLVVSYRRYYREHKQPIMRMEWTNRKIPLFMKDSSCDSQ